MEPRDTHELSFSTGPHPSAEAAEAWSDVFCEHVLGATATVLNADRFSVDMRQRPAGRIGLLKAQMSAVRHDRQDGQVRRDGDRNVSILFADFGDMVLRSPGLQTRLTRSGALIGAHDIAHVAEWRERTSMFVIEVSGDLLDEAGAPDDRDYLEIVRDDPALGLLRGYAEMVWRLEPAVRLASAARIEAHVADLATDLFSRRNATPSLRASDGRRVQALLQLIETDFADPTLSVREAARRLNLSQASIPAAMDLVGETFLQALLRRRLTEVARRLSHSGRPISEVAMDCGFSDISYFNRRFHDRFGMSPRAYRQAQLTT